MAHFRRKKRKKATKKIIGESPNASLAAMAPMIEQKGIFQAIYEQVLIPQKTLDYRPTDKLVSVVHNFINRFENLIDCYPNLQSGSGTGNSGLGTGKLGRSHKWIAVTVP